jgi:hypothetical protein
MLRHATRRLISRSAVRCELASGKRGEFGSAFHNHPEWLHNHEANKRQGKDSMDWYTF